MLTPRRGSLYCSYLLRCIQQRGRNPPQWHFSLEDTRSAERRGFASLEELIAALQEEFSDGASMLHESPDLRTAPLTGED
ncbi:MAG: hypothetical protein M3439_11895 [Chloroflexota bacterium]|nr:hypothetical protein [Chloroflexota bacterium]